MNSVSQEIGNKLKQIQVLMSVMSGEAQGAVPPGQLEQFGVELQATLERIGQLREPTPSEGKPQIQELTTNLTLSIFVLSTLTAIAVAFYVSRFFNRRLGKLREGA